MSYRGIATYVLVALLVGAGVLVLAAPAWSEDNRTRKEGSGSGETKTQGSSAQTDKKEKSGSRRAGSASSTQERNQASDKDKRNKAQGSGKGPLAGEKVKVENGSGDPNVVDDGDVLTIQGNYKIKSNASVTVKDKDGTQGTFTNNENAKIKTGSVKIQVEDAPIGASADGELSTEGLVVAASDGIEAQRNGRGRGGRGRGINCDIKIGNAAIQYGDVIQVCRGGGGGGRNERGSVNLEIEIEEEIEITGEGVSEETAEEETIEERSADTPDGAVADTSALDTLPNTGGPSLGPSLLGSTLAPALTILTAGGVGLSVWRFGSRRSRPDDD